MGEYTKPWLSFDSSARMLSMTFAGSRLATVYDSLCLSAYLLRVELNNRESRVVHYQQ